MQPFQQRVIDEKTDLDAKIEKLTEFTDATNHLFTTLPEDEQVRLGRQLAIMTDYSKVLGERISFFPPPSLTIIN